MCVCVCVFAVICLYVCMYVVCMYVHMYAYLLTLKEWQINVERSSNQCALVDDITKDRFN